MNEMEASLKGANVCVRIQKLNSHTEAKCCQLKNSATARIT